VGPSVSMFLLGGPRMVIRGVLRSYSAHTEPFSFLVYPVAQQGRTSAACSPGRVERGKNPGWGGNRGSAGGTGGPGRSGGDSRGTNGRPSLCTRLQGLEMVLKGQELGRSHLPEEGPQRVKVGGYPGPNKGPRVRVEQEALPGDAKKKPDRGRPQAGGHRGGPGRGRPPPDFCRRPKYPSNSPCSPLQAHLLNFKENICGQGNCGRIFRLRGETIESVYRKPPGPPGQGPAGPKGQFRPAGVDHRRRASAEAGSSPCLGTVATGLNPGRAG